MKEYIEVTKVGRTHITISSGGEDYMTEQGEGEKSRSTQDPVIVPEQDNNGETVQGLQRNMDTGINSENLSIKDREQG